MTDLTHGQQPSADTQAPAGHVDTEWVCVPCFTMKPRASGHVTVHGTGRGGDPASLTVWCPWCGDRMERAGGCLTDDEVAALHTTTEWVAVTTIEHAATVEQAGDRCGRCGAARNAGEAAWRFTYESGDTIDGCSACAAELAVGAVDPPEVLEDGE